MAFGLTVLSGVRVALTGNVPVTTVSTAHGSLGREWSYTTWQLWATAVTLFPSSLLSLGFFNAWESPVCLCHDHWCS